MLFAVTILGSSSATPTRHRNPSAQVLNVNERLFLTDCGEGTQMQLKRYGFNLKRLNYIFISHLHGDHYLGLPGLLFTMHLFGRTNTLHLFAPPDLKPILDSIFKASETNLLYPLEFHPLASSDDTEEIYSDDKIIIKSFSLIHRVPTWGFIFSEPDRERNINKDFLLKEDVTIEDIKKIKHGDNYISKSGQLYLNEKITHSPVRGKSYAYCSDTAYNEKMIPYIKGSDIIYHEATFMSELQSSAADKQHSTAADAARTAKAAEAGNLIIGHFSARYKDINPLLEEAKAIFPNTYAAEEGVCYKLKQDRTIEIISPANNG